MRERPCWYTRVAGSGAWRLPRSPVRYWPPARRWSTESPRWATRPTPQLAVKGDSNAPFDRIVKNSLSDIEDFWTGELPEGLRRQAVAAAQGRPVLRRRTEGRRRPSASTGPAPQNACAQRNAGFVVDNGAFCTLDDSIAWDRAPHPPVRPARAEVRRPHRRPDLRPRVRARDQLPARHLRPEPADDRHRVAGRLRGRRLGRVGAEGRAAALPRRHPAVARRRARGLPQRSRQHAQHPAGRLARQRLRPALGAGRRHRQGRHLLLLEGLLRVAHLHRAPVHEPERLRVRRRHPDLGGAEDLVRQLLRQGPEPVLDGGGEDGEQDLPAGQDRAGDAPAVRLQRCERVRLLPERQHRLLQPVPRAEGLQQPARREGRLGDRQRHPVAEPARRLRARRAVLDRLGHGRAAPAVQPLARRRAGADRGGLLLRLVREGHQHRAGHPRGEDQGHHRCRRPTSTRRRRR